MKKSFLFPMILSFCIFQSCSSLPKNASFYVEKEKIEPFTYEIRNVTVNIDFLEETEIAEQFNNLLITKLNKQNTNGMKVIYIDVNVNQRSFIQDIQQKNSIFMNFTGYDEDNNIILRDNSYFVGSSTFIASTDQYKCGKTIITNLLKFQNDVEKYYLKKNEE